MATKTYTPLTQAQRIQKILSKPGVSANREEDLQKKYNQLTGNQGIVPRTGQVAVQASPAKSTKTSVNTSGPKLVDYGSQAVSSTAGTSTKSSEPYYFGQSTSGQRGKTVKDPATGRTYSADSVKGQELSKQYGYTDAPVAPEAPASYEDIGKANIQAEYDANIAAELGLTGEAKGYTSMEEYYKDLYQQSKEQAALQREQYDLQKTQTGEQTADQRNTLEGQVEAASGLMGNQEGVVSQSNISAHDRLKEASTMQISRLQRDQDMANKAIEQAKVDLDRAERAGNTELAASYKEKLLAAESAAQQTETDYVNALTMASEEERNVQAQKNANISSFTGLVDQGVELTSDNLIEMAQTMGIPFEVAYGYYQGSQAIRDDKSLSLEEKQIANAQNLQNLNDQITGMDIEEVKKATVYNDMVKSGQYSEDQLKVLSSVMGIPDKYNESYQADLAVKQAEAKIKQAEANGQIVNPIDQLEYASALADYYDKIGKVPGTIPAGGGSVETTAIQTGNGIQFNFQDNTKISSGSRALTQCGQFVNDVLGLKMGDSFASKMSYVDSNIRFPEPGMAFVQAISGDYAKNGHTGIVEYYDPSTQMVGVADVNSKGDGIARHHEISLATILDGGGFVPGNGVPLDKNTATEEAVAINDGLSALASSASSKFSYDAVSKGVDGYIQSGDYDKAKNLILTTAANSLDTTSMQDFKGSKLTADLLSGIREDLQTLASKNIDTGFLKGKEEDVLRNIGKTSDPEVAKLQSKIFSAIQRYRKAITGAGFAESETEEYNKIFPGIGKSQELNIANIDALDEVLQANIDSYYSSILGEDVYNGLIGKTVEEENPWDAVDTVSSNDILNDW